MTCPLCVREPMTHCYHEDEYCWVVDCSSCGTPMIVWKAHVESLSPAENQHVCQVLSDLFGHFEVDGRRRTYPEHWHAHVRGEEGVTDNPGKDLQMNPLDPAAWAAERDPCALAKPWGPCPDDREGVHFALDWGLAARYALFKASRSGSIGIVLTYDLTGLPLEPDHDAVIEKTHGDYMVGEVSYYLEEFDILEDPDEPDYDRLAALMEGEAEMHEPEPAEYYSVEQQLIENAKGSIFMLLSEKLSDWSTADEALSAIKNADVPKAWWAEAIGQLRTHSVVGDDRLVRVQALKPVMDEIATGDVPDEALDERLCPVQLTIDDLDCALADTLEGMAVTLWESPQARGVAQPYFHGTDLSRAEVILAAAPAAAELKNPWDPCTQP